jgi:hypothetical protein
MAQNSPVANSATGRALWEPPDYPDLGLLQKTPPTIPKLMVSDFRLADFEIVFEKTPLTALQSRFGGEIGSIGDASETLEWLCLTGSGKSGRWVVWLESSEVDGGTVGSFQWQGIAQRAEVDHRCVQLPSASGGMKLSNGLHPGISEDDLFRILGKPSTRNGNVLVFLHEHQETIHNEPYTVSNTVSIILSGGIVTAITVVKDTIS